MARKVTSLTFDLFGRDRTASKSMKGVGDQAGKTAQTLRRAGAAMAAGIAAAGAAAVAFGVQSVKAFAEAQEAQNRLLFALEKFPKLADTNIEALRKLNSALQSKTRFDDDAIASGQAVLATFGLTGKQLKQLTPLLLDYAARTGKDLTLAAEDLGRALNGQGRALRVLGINFKDTGSLTGNFDQLMGDLSTTVGGFAEKDAQTAAGKLDQLKNRFGDVQEVIGEALMPALEKMMDWIDSKGLPLLEGFGRWFAEDGVDSLSRFIEKIAEMAEDGRLVPNVVAGIGAITAAQWGMNAAMAANPVGIVIAGIAALASLAVAVVANWNDVTKIVFSTTGGIMKGIFSVAIGVAQGIQNVINAILGGIARIVGPINAIANLFGLSGIAIPSSVDFVSRLQRMSSQLGQMIDAGAIGGIDYLSNGYQMGGGKGPAGTAGGLRAFAAGGIVQPTRGGTPALIGEAGYAEAVIPLTRSALADYGLGGTGQTVYNVTVNGVISSQRSELMKFIVRGIQDAQKLGDIPRGALA